ncbi:MAG: HAMP domain-containing protein, partial [Gemmatimonadales bacterium]|nr:HAMP domain-containing protein [Gemmatimonadales bacterium]
MIAATAIVATRSISTPLRGLAAAARRFGRGEGALPVGGSGSAEVHLLVRAF